MLRVRDNIVNQRRMSLNKYNLLLDNELGIIHIADELSSLMSIEIQNGERIPFLQYIHKEDIKKFEETLSSKFERCNFRITLADDKVMYVDSIIYYKCIDNPEASYLLSIYDETPLINYYNSLFEYNQKLRAVADNTNDIVIIYHEDSIIYANQIAVNQLGYTQEELTQIEPYILIAPEEKERIEELELIFRDHILDTHRFRTNIITAKGEKLLCDCKAKLIKHKGFTSILVIIQDITEKENALEQLTKAKQQAESANKTKSDFLAMMSHEIRTPMNGVIGMTSLLLNTQLSSEQRDYAETIQLSGESLIKIINDILDFTKIESDRLKLEDTTFELRSCIEDIYDLFAMQAIGKGLDLLYLIDNNVPSYLIGDITRLKQVLSNLISNAIKFTEKGEVFTSVELLSGLDKEVLELKFSIKDSGIGIPSDKAAYIFEAFTQADTSTTRRYGGTGLGLPISKKLVELMGGELWVISEINVGSTFYFTIKLKNAKYGQPKVHVKGHLPELKGHKVLIVDDNEINRLILKVQFETWGMVPTVCESAAYALKTLEQQSDFSLGVIDLQMPDMDGEQLAFEIKKVHSFPLMLLSSSGHAKASYANLFESQLSKPVRHKDMFKEVIKLRSQHGKPETRLNNAHQIDEKLNEKYPLRILIAEDNLVNQKLVISLLSKMGFKVKAVVNGKEAVEIVQKEKFDIVLMDIQMPELTGIEATEIIKAKVPSNQQPLIIALTANAMTEDKEHCLRCGMVDYMSKPININILQAMLIKWGSYLSKSKDLAE